MDEVGEGDDKFVAPLLLFLQSQGCTPEEIFSIHISIVETLDAARRRQSGNDASG